jgi:hypothetical protein
MRRMVRKADTSFAISSMAKKANPVLTAADGLSAVFKVNEAHFFVLLASPTAFQDDFSPSVCEGVSDEKWLMPNIFMRLCSISQIIPSD